MVNDHLPDVVVDTLLIAAHEQVKPVAAGFRIADFIEQFFVFQGDEFKNLDKINPFGFNA